MRILPVTLDQLFRLKQVTSDDPDLHELAKQFEGLAYYGDEIHRILLLDDDGYPVDDDRLAIMQILWEATRAKRRH